MIFDEMGRKVCGEKRRFVTKKSHRPPFLLHGKNPVTLMHKSGRKKVFATKQKAVRRKASFLVFNREGHFRFEQIAINGDLEFSTLKRSQISGNGEAQTAAFGGPGGISANETFC